MEAYLLGPYFLERNELKMSEDCAQTDQPRHGGTKVVESGTEPGSPKADWGRALGYFWNKCQLDKSFL